MGENLLYAFYISQLDVPSDVLGEMSMSLLSYPAVAVALSTSLLIAFPTGPLFLNSPGTIVLQEKRTDS